MKDKIDITRAPLVAPRPSPQIRSVETTSGGLIRSTVIAGTAALAVLTVVYLPSEYGIDPTGFGAVLGLTEMGQIKQQLYAEAEADAAATPVVLAPAVMARLDRMEAQLVAIGAIVGAPMGAAVARALDGASEAMTGIATDAVAVPDPVPGNAAPAPAVEAEVAEAITSEWRDERSYTLVPGEGIEVKLVMQEGQTARFEWTANGGVVNFDTHGDGGGQKISYETGRGVPGQAGELTAAFTGNHGWFWRNRTDAPVTVTLRTAGDYAEVKAP